MPANSTTALAAPTVTVRCELLIDVLALKAVLTEEQAGAFKREREKALRESGYATHPNLHRYDEILAKYRGGQ
jgi:hypothetical protein